VRKAVTNWWGKIAMHASKRHFVTARKSQNVLHLRASQFWALTGLTSPPTPPAHVAAPNVVTTVEASDVGRCTNVERRRLKCWKKKITQPFIASNPQRFTFAMKSLMRQSMV
jgi:hypothetical protein